MTNGQNNLTKRPHHRRNGRFNRIRQVAILCTPSNICFLGSIRVHIPNGILIGSAVFALLTAKCPYTLQCFPCPLKIAYSHVELGPIQYVVPPESTTQTASRLVERFSRAQDCVRPTDGQTTIPGL